MWYTMGINDLFKSLFSNDIVRNTAFVSTAVLAGYCLQPVPETFHNAFNTQPVLKFFILFIMTIIAMKPENDFQMGVIAMIIVVLLAVLEMYRGEKQVDVEVKQFETMRPGLTALL